MSLYSEDIRLESLKCADLSQSRKCARRILALWGQTHRIIKSLELTRAQYFADIAEARDTVRAKAVSGIHNHHRHADTSDVAVRIERAIERFSAESQRINDEVADILRINNAVQHVIFQLPPKQLNIIFKRYRENWKWDRIAYFVGLDASHARRLEREAVDFVRENLSL